MDEKTIARFWAKVDRSAGPDGCWLWTAGKARGYGKFTVVCKTLQAHRVAFEMANGTVPAGDHHGTMCVCHRCDATLCVNPAHLFLGTVADNNADRDTKGRTARPRGEANAAAKLTRETVAALRGDRAAGMLYRELAAKYRVSEVHARRVAVGRSWARSP